MKTSPLKNYYRQRAREVLTKRRNGELPAPPRARYPKQSEREYLRDLLPWVVFMRAAIDQTLLPALPAILARHQARKDHEAAPPLVGVTLFSAGGGDPERAARKLRMDAEADEISRLIGDVKVTFQRRYTQKEAEVIAKKHAARARAYTAEEMTRQFRRVLGVDPFIGAPAIEDAVRMAVVENVALIKSIPEQYFGQVEKSVFAHVRSGAPFDELVDDLQARYEVSVSRATMIARDQTAKMNGALTEVTQRSLGLTGYVWRTSGDARVRDTHADLDGKKFEWDAPPSVGHPGQDYNCRCDAEPDFGKLLPEDDE